MLAKQWIVVGSMSGFFAVVLGAFGAHFLKEKLTERLFLIYQTAVQYHMYHAIALVCLGLWASQNPEASTQMPGWSFTLGITLFSGSLYALALTDLKWLGAIAPLGGTAFLIGWFTFAMSAWRA